MNKPIFFFPRNPHTGNIDEWHFPFYQDQNNPNYFIKFEGKIQKIYLFSNLKNEIQSPLFYKPENGYGPEGFLYEFIPPQFINCILNNESIKSDIEDPNSITPVENNSDSDTISDNNSDIITEVNDVLIQTDFSIMNTTSIGIQCNLDDEHKSISILKKYFYKWRSNTIFNIFIKNKYIKKWRNIGIKNRYLQQKYINKWRNILQKNKYKRERNLKKKFKKREIKIEENKIKKDIISYWFYNSITIKKIAKYYANLWKQKTINNKLIRKTVISKLSLIVKHNKELRIKWGNIWLSKHNEIKLQKKYFSIWLNNIKKSKTIVQITKKKKIKKKKKSKNYIFGTNNIPLFNAFDQESKYYFNKINNFNKNKKTNNLNNRIFYKIFYYLDTESYINILNTNSTFKLFANTNLVKIPQTKKIIMDELSNRNIIHMLIYNLNDSYFTLNNLLLNDNDFKELPNDSIIKTTLDPINNTKIVTTAICNLYRYNKDQLKYIYEYTDSKEELDKYVSQIKSYILADKQLNKNTYTIVCNPNNLLEIIEFRYETKEFFTYIISPLRFVKHLIDLISNILNVTNVSGQNIFDKYDHLPIYNIIYSFLNFESPNSPEIHNNITNIITSLLDTRILIRYLNFNDKFNSFHKECCILESRLAALSDTLKIWYCYIGPILPSIFKDWFKYIKDIKEPCYYCGNNIQSNDITLKCGHQYHSTCLNISKLTKESKEVSVDNLNCVKCDLKLHPLHNKIAFNNKYFTKIPIILSIIKENKNIFSPLMFTLNPDTTMQLKSETIKSFKLIDKNLSEKYIFSAYHTYFKDVNPDIVFIQKSYKIKLVPSDDIIDICILNKLSEVLKTKYKYDEVRIAFRKYLSKCKKYNLNKSNLIVVKDVKENIYVTSAAYLEISEEKKI
jgi:hypothetical protein